MRKINFNKLIFVFLIAIIIIILFTIVNNIDNRIAFSAWLSSPNVSFVKSNTLRKIVIKFSNDDKEHFEKLFKDYHGEGIGVENNAFLDYFAKHNKWRKTILYLEGKQYKVKIKAMGRTPYAHKYGDHFSLTVKFIEKPYPFYSQRVNLIIYNRIQMRSSFIKLIASKFNLPNADFELVLANIGNNSNYLYFVEERINDDFFLKRKLPWLIFNENVDGSIIYHGNESLHDLNDILSDKLKKRNDISQQLKIQIALDYEKFNNAIYLKNFKAIKEYLDLNYCARLNAYRIINGSDGHGFDNVNFEMAYDTISRKFFPIVNRDGYGSVLRDCNNPYPFMDQTRAVIPFFITLDSDSIFRDYTKHVVDSFLTSNSKLKISIKNEIKSIYDYYLKSHKYEFSSINNGSDGTWIIENIDCLMNCTINITKPND